MPDHYHNHVHTQEETPHGPSYHPPIGFQPYVPNDLLFFVEHEADVLPDEALDTTWLINLISAAYDLSPFLSTEDLIPVPTIHLRAFDPERAAVEPHYRLFCVRTANLDTAALYRFFYGEEAAPEGLTKLGIPLTANVEGEDQVVGTLQHVFPHWFNGAAPHIGIGSHGPGGPPHPIPNSRGVNGLRFEFDNANPGGTQSGFASAITSATAHAADEKAVVYILDTLPPRCRLQSALSTWPLLRPFFAPILTPIADPNPVNPDVYRTEKATYYYVGATGQDFSALLNVPEGHENYATGYHHYDSSDHGLFIAGIVHMIAPTVQLHVIQVMDDYGVGTFMNYTAGMLLAGQIQYEHQKKHPRAQAIINCSFTFSIPIDGHQGSSPNYDLQQYEANHPGFANQMIDFQDAVRVVLTPDTVILAAAGNDSSPVDAKGNPQSPLAARYPAALNTVYGVGALKGDRQRTADYSNTADAPVSDGIYVVGGEYKNQAVWIVNARDYIARDDDEAGLISIFTGNLNIELAHVPPPVLSWLDRIRAFLRIRPYKIVLPPHDSGVFFNPTGFAEWKGTSFATPVVAGTIAQWCVVRSVPAPLALNDVYGFRSMGVTGAGPATNLSVVYQTRS